MQRDAPTSTTPPRRRLLLLAAGASVLALVGTAAIIWLVWFSSAAPAPASLDEAVGAVGSASPTAGSAPRASPSATVDASAAPSAEPAADGVDGSWTVDTSIGSFADYTSSFAGFRVDDVIVAVGSIDVTFTDFGVVMPTAPIVVSVEDNGQIEFQLFFSRA